MIPVQILTAPGKYIQGNGALADLGQYAAPLGRSALCLLSASGRNRFQTILDASFAKAGVQIRYALFNGECTRAEIDRVLGICEDSDTDVIIGLGGGKIHDAAKAVSYYRKNPIIVVPTTVSTDAPCSRSSVIYDENGVVVDYLLYENNPNLVLVDSGVIAKAPVRLLVAGMGDALATYFEARTCAASGRYARGVPTLAAQALAKACYETLLRDGYLAKLAVEAGLCTAALERIIEANTLLSSIGFENGGLAAAHAIHDGLTIIPACHAYHHGEKVAFGTLVQLVLEQAPMAEIETVMAFCRQVGLPITLTEIGLGAAPPQALQEAAEIAAAKKSMQNLVHPVKAADVYAALLLTDRLGKEFSIKF